MSGEKKKRVEKKHGGQVIAAIAKSIGVPFSSDRPMALAVLRHAHTFMELSDAKQSLMAAKAFRVKLFLPSVHLPPVYNRQWQANTGDHRQRIVAEMQWWSASVESLTIDDARWWSSLFADKTYAAAISFPKLRRLETRPSLGPDTYEPFLYEEKAWITMMERCPKLDRFVCSRLRDIDSISATFFQLKTCKSWPQRAWKEFWIDRGEPATPEFCIELANPRLERLNAGESSWSYYWEWTTEQLERFAAKWQGHSDRLTEFVYSVYLPIGSGNDTVAFAPVVHILLKHFPNLKRWVTERRRDWVLPTDTVAAVYATWPLPGNERICTEKTRQVLRPPPNAKEPVHIRSTRLPLTHLEIGEREGNCICQHWTLADALEVLQLKNTNWQRVVIDRWDDEDVDDAKTILGNVLPRSPALQTLALRQNVVVSESLLQEAMRHCPSLVDLQLGAMVQSKDRPVVEDTTIQVSTVKRFFERTAPDTASQLGLFSVVLSHWTANDVLSVADLLNERGRSCVLVVPSAVLSDVFAIWRVQPDRQSYFFRARPRLYNVKEVLTRLDDVAMLRANVPYTLLMRG